MLILGKRENCNKKIDENKRMRNLNVLKAIIQTIYLRDIKWRQCLLSRCKDYDYNERAKYSRVWLNRLEKARETIFYAFPSRLFFHISV